MAMIIVTADGTRYEFMARDIVSLTYHSDTANAVSDLHERVEDSIVAERQDYVPESPPEDTVGADISATPDEIPIIADTQALSDTRTIAAKVEDGTIEDRAIDYILDKATAPPSYVDNACDQRPFTVEYDDVTKAVQSAEDKATGDLIDSFVGNTVETETPTIAPVADVLVEVKTEPPKPSDATIQEI